MADYFKITEFNNGNRIMYKCNRQLLNGKKQYKTANSLSFD